MAETPQAAVVNGSKLLSLTQAAKACGKSKGTLSKALKAGRLSYVSKDDGGYQIDPAELQRWVSATPPRNRPVPDEQPAMTTPETSLENSIERVKVDVMAERLADAEKTIEDLRERLDASEKERRGLTERLLPAPQNARERPKRFFGWFGAKNA